MSFWAANRAIRNAQAGFAQTLNKVQNVVNALNVHELPKYPNKETDVIIPYRDKKGTKNIFMVVDKATIVKSLNDAVDAVKDVYIDYPDEINGKKYAESKLLPDYLTKFKVAAKKTIKDAADGIFLDGELINKRWETHGRKEVGDDPNKFFIKYNKPNVTVSTGSSRSVSSDERAADSLMFFLKCVTVILLGYMAYSTVTKK